MKTPFAAATLVLAALTFVQAATAQAGPVTLTGQVVKYVREKKLTFPVWLGATTEHMLAFGLGAELPGTVIVGRDGTIVARYKGIIKESELRKEIDALLARQQAAAGEVARAQRSSVPA